MNKEKIELVNYRLMRTKETLEDARILFGKKKLFSTVNRIYYAMFYVVSALLLIRNLSSSKHTGILGLFNKEFVRDGIVSRDLGRFYNEMFEFRQKGDYKDLVRFKREDVRQWLERAENFIQELSGLIGKKKKK